MSERLPKYFGFTEKWIKKVDHAGFEGLVVC